MATTFATNEKIGKQPTYRQRMGYSQAIVTLTDKPIGKSNPRGAAWRAVAQHVCCTA